MGKNKGYICLYFCSLFILQYIEDLTKEKFSLQRALEASQVLAESLAAENSTLTDNYNQQVCPCIAVYNFEEYSSLTLLLFLISLTLFSNLFFS